MSLIEDNIDGHSPLPGNVYIDKSAIHGMGIFARVDIPKGYNFGITHVADERFPDGYIRTPLGGFINHSNDPNVEMYEIEDFLRMRTVKAVNKGDELTVDYRPWYKEEVLATYG